MYQLEGEELVRVVSTLRADFPPEDTKADEDLTDLLTGRTRIFQGLDGLLILLWPLERSFFRDEPLPSWVQARIEAAQMHQHALHVFVAMLTDHDQREQWEEALSYYLLWNETQGVGTVLREEDNDEEGAPEDIWAADLCEYLTVAFEEPGPADSPI